MKDKKSMYRKNHVPFVVNDEELAQIEVWQRKHGVWNRSEAIRILIRAGLANVPETHAYGNPQNEILCGQYRASGTELSYIAWLESRVLQPSSPRVTRRAAEPISLPEED